MMFVCCGYVAERYILFASRRAAIIARQVRSKSDFYPGFVLVETSRGEVYVPKDRN